MIQYDSLMWTRKLSVILDANCFLFLFPVYFCGLVLLVSYSMQVQRHAR